MKIRMNYHTNTEVGEINKGKSMTVPGQALTPQEIYHRYVQGRPLPTQGVPQYNPNMYYPNLDAMDLSDVEKYRDALANKIKAEQEFLDHTEQEQERERSDREFMAKVDEEIARRKAGETSQSTITT